MDNKKILQQLNKLKTFCNIPKSASWNNYKVLQTALQCEQNDVASYLISAGCRVNNKYLNVIENTPLHYAIRLEDINLITKLISKGALLTCQNKKGETPFHVAIMSRNTEIVDLLLNYIDLTHYVNYENDFGLTHLHIACMRNRADIVRNFLEHGAETDIAVNENSPLWAKYTPLHFAVEFDCLEVVQLLMRYKANRECQDAEKRNPCCLAYEKYQNASMIDYFLGIGEGSRKASLFFGLREYYVQDVMDTKTNFFVACLGGHLDIIKKQLKCGASVNSRAYACYIFQGDTPLHCAIRSECVDTVKFLLKNGANTNSLNYYGMTPLHAAFYQQKSEFDFVLLDTIYNAYDFTKLGNVVDRNGLSYFHIICSKGDVALVQYFLENGADVNSQIDKKSKYYAGCTPLYFAVRNYDADSVALLLRYGADITIISDIPVDTLNIFEIILINRWVEVIQIIADTGLNLNTIKGDSGSAYHIVLNYISIIKNCDNLKKAEEIIKILHNYGCNINNQSDNGNTPLHELFCHVFIKILLDLGADINIENMKGQTPLTKYQDTDLSNSNKFSILMYPEQYKVYLSHVEKLKSIGFYVSEKNRLFIKRLFDHQAQIDPDKSFLDSEYYSDLSKQCKNEIDKTKHIKLADYLTLYDILFADADQMAIYCNSEILLNIIDSCDFDDQFPSYGYLLKLQLKKGNQRKAAIHALTIVFKRELPYLCSRKIFSYLSDDDLRTFTHSITCTNDNLTKNLQVKKSNALVPKFEFDNKDFLYAFISQANFL